MAYGQTSSGKTHTIEGNIRDGTDSGIMPRAMDCTFQMIEQAPGSIEFTVRMSYVELYCEKIQDLLHPGNDNLKIFETPDDGVSVQDATCGK